MFTLKTLFLFTAAQNGCQAMKTAVNIGRFCTIKCYGRVVDDNRDGDCQTKEFKVYDF